VFYDRLAVPAIAINIHWSNSMNRRRSCISVLCVGLLGILITTGTAYAQTAPDASGTVSCVQVDSTANVSTATYTVDWYYGTALVASRWGSGLDQVYDWGFGYIETSKRFTTYTMNFYSMSTDNFENFYSETGEWVMRVGKDNAVTVTGKSFIVHDLGTARYSGECTWNLKGTLQSN
jgi:hypothetical protein